ncbi:MAG: hypothetical protein ACRECC_00495 [Pseudolabrys sp.]
MNSISPRSLFTSALKVLEMAFRHLERQVPPPRRKPWKDGFVFRYAEQTIQQAIVQKLARIISGLHAVDALLEKGLLQEQGMVQRALDEINEDIIFLSLGVINNDITARHHEYLKYFYAEEFGDPRNVSDSHSSRGMIRREKIRAYVNKGAGSEESRANAAGKILAKAYSGFIHAASPHIMDMCAGEPPRFDIGGMFSHLRTEHADDALNYFYRSLISMAFAARAFGDEKLFSQVREAATQFDAAMGAHRRSNAF